jgi:dsDNA-specific endonuclease/ATPase MutS2
MKRYLLSAMLLLGAAAPALANEGAAKANLSPELSQKVQAERGKYKDQLKPLWQDMRDANQALRAEMAKAQPSDATLAQLEERIAGDRAKMQQLHQQMQSELKSQLSPKEIAQLMIARQDHFGRRFHHRGGGEGGNTQQ